MQKELLNNMQFLRNKFVKMLLYPTLTALLFLVIGALFWRAVLFLSTSIHSTFVSQSQFAGQLIAINFPNAELVAKKLSLTLSENKIETPVEVITSSSPAIVSSTTQIISTSSEVGITTPIQEINKKDLKIEILNSTATRGLARSLKTILLDAGFSVLRTGNQAAIEPTTIVKIKKSVHTNPFIQEILAIVSKQYTTQEIELDESSLIDVQIVIGTQ